MKNNKFKVNFLIDKRCDQHCKYCKHGNSKPEVRTDEEIYTAFEYAMNKVEELFGKYTFRPQLQGGEPTLMGKELTHRICERLSGYDEVLVFSNGYDRKSEFYTRDGYEVVTHIISWYGFDISKYPLLPNETLAFVITHDEVCRVSGLLSTATGKERIQLMPCWHENSAWHCTSEDRVAIDRYQREYERETENGEEPRPTCASLKIPFVDCTTLEIASCGFIPEYKPLETFKKEELKKKEEPCRGCASSGASISRITMGGTW